MTHDTAGYDALEWIVVSEVAQMESISLDTGEVDEYGEPIYLLLPSHQTQEPYTIKE